MLIYSLLYRIEHDIFSFSLYSYFKFNSMHKRIFFLFFLGAGGWGQGRGHVRFSNQHSFKACNVMSVIYNLFLRLLMNFFFDGSSLGCNQLYLSAN